MSLSKKHLYGKEKSMGLNKTVHILLLPRLGRLLQALRSIPPQLTAIAGDFFAAFVFQINVIVQKAMTIMGQPDYVAHFVSRKLLCWNKVKKKRLKKPK
ncbi:hypothetical protein ACTUTK_03425 [Pantoea ananatis]|uniref:hypothetical protein n=2 Tax=Pantoea ananas TaxID=553 RepID=UPI001B30854F|nr:hypothetical protein [Pantoea ananatis]MCH9268067.1 hypothetical protein [Pantoea ananatis]